jgi:anaerobic carbon-monoxide dehydrogenase iron sulfur subunit
MRVLSYDPELCVGCYVCEEVCSTTFFKKTDGEKTRIKIEVEGGELPSAVFCNQCGECISVCPAEAIYRDRRGVVQIRQQLCVGCLSCVGVCPYSAMFYHPEENVPFKCISCGICAKECPAGALEVIDVETPSTA